MDKGSKPDGPSGGWLSAVARYRAQTPNAETDEAFVFAFRTWLREEHVKRAWRDLLPAVISAIVTLAVSDNGSFHGVRNAVLIAVLTALTVEGLSLLSYWLRAPILQRDALRADVGLLRTKLFAYERPPTTAYARDHSVLEALRSQLEAIVHLLAHPPESEHEVSEWLAAADGACTAADNFSRHGSLSPLARALINVPIEKGPTKAMPKKMVAIPGTIDRWVHLEHGRRGLSAAIAALEAHVMKVEVPS